MKVVVAKLAIAVAALAAVHTSAFATPCEIVPGTFPPVCVPTPTAEVPEPSSPMLFLAAFAVAGIVVKIRKKK
jgi:hypothetical protein